MVAFESAPAPKESLVFRAVGEDVFRDFASHHGSSEEVGRIGTFFDNDSKGAVRDEPRLYGLWGCGRLTAVVCLTIFVNPADESRSCRLDSVIVDPALRRRGLASLLIAHAFQDIIETSDFIITMFHSHAVHPATVKMLRHFMFSDPPVRGAPLISVHVDDGNRDEFLARCASIVQEGAGQLKLYCAYCLKRDRRRSRPWCVG